MSHEGLFVESQTVFAQGAVLQVKMTTRDGKDVLVDGTVQWSKKYAVRYSNKLKSGMGLHIKRFHQGEELFRSFCPRENCLDCASNEDKG